jgi:hypothetical protein
MRLPTTAPAGANRGGHVGPLRLQQDQPPDPRFAPANSRHVPGMAAALSQSNPRALPAAPAFAVASGPHGHGVIVHPGAGVEVLGRSREHVIRLAAFFFATVARDRLPFSVVASIGPVETPGQADTYHLSVVGGAVIASRD